MIEMTLYLGDEAWNQLLVVARKNSGQDKPSELQLHNTFGGLARFALQRAYEQCIVPEPVTQPLPVALPVASPLKVAP